MSDAPVFAAAKINLFLHVTGRRADGLHLLQSLFVYASVGDYLSVMPSADMQLDLAGPFAAALTGQDRAAKGNNSDNIIVRAGEALKEKVGDPSLAAGVSLQKNLPVAAGIGGGSADAAAALRMLNRFWDLELSEADLMALALSLGADVPACLAGRASWVEGVGEQVTPLADFPALDCVLVNPMVEVSTPEVFRRFADRRQDFSATLPRWQGGKRRDLLTFLGNTQNDLEDIALGIAPQIADALDAISAEAGCALARMSGSGATCFGLFDNSADAALAATNLKAAHPGWWVEPALLGNAVDAAADKALDF